MKKEGYHWKTNGTWDAEPEEELTAYDLLREDQIRKEEIEGIISYISYEVSYQMQSCEVLETKDKIKILSKIRSNLAEQLKQLKDRQEVKGA